MTMYLIFRYPWIEKGGFESWILLEHNYDYNVVRYFERLIDTTHDKWRLSKRTNVANLMSIGYTPEGIFTLEELKNSRYKSFSEGIK